MNQKNIAFNLFKKISNLSGKTALIFFSLLCSALPAQAVNFNFTYSDDTSTSQKEAFEMAGSMWKELLQDDVTVNIHVDFADNNRMPTNVLGGAIPGFYSSLSNQDRTGYQAYKQKLRDDRESDNDYKVFDIENANIPNNYIKDDWWVYMLRDKDLPFVNRMVHSYGVSLTRANAKAVGMINPHDSDVDAVILMNKLNGLNYGWTTDYLANEVGYWNFDLTSVAMHEIGHALGFVSSMDYFDTNNFSDTLARHATFTSFDMFRRGSSTQTWQTIDMNNQSGSYFSLDNGSTALGQLSTGQDTSLGADGYQGSHWSAFDGVEDLMDPTLPTNRRRTVSYKDLAALDVIGWDANYDGLNFDDLDSLRNLAQSQAANAQSTNPVDSLNKMFNQYGWGGSGRGRSGFRQDMDLADYLAQEGLFQKGAFWSHMQANKASVPEPSSILGLLGLGLFIKGYPRRKTTK
ncbi:hypothetical protein NIES267_06980 [Calothrix parasitica NIES-267]|uniref:Ice-binding protein C-terminal domain-containing protein n=1 Tax=Calothrix parasitica NIES-267 TaxID=1973488 RepID=A0A1Z4LJ14_9CYAN|nr:hypothetical protein NIES267_06980 [Calothrix parasitica NIES-267]